MRGASGQKRVEKSARRMTPTTGHSEKNTLETVKNSGVARGDDGAERLYSGGTALGDSAVVPDAADVSKPVDFSSDTGPQVNWTAVRKSAPVSAQPF